MKRIKALLAIQRLVSGDWIGTDYLIEIEAPSEVLPILALNGSDSLMQLALADVSLLPHSGLRVAQFYTEEKDSK